MNWQASASIAVLKQRAAYLQQIRHFFNQRAYLEVETPYMGRFGVTDPMLANIKASFRQETFYLQTSPEYHMKRLLASGSGPIYQIARVFRDDEYGRWHNPEFTLLEWYQVDVDHWYLIRELEALIQHLADVPNFLHLSYHDAFQAACDINPHLITLNEIQAVCERYELAGVLAQEESLDQHLHLLMAFVVEPYLKSLEKPVIIFDFPASQASLAKVEGNLAKRFELYWQGVELANGFYEQTDHLAQLNRFEEDNRIRAQMGLPLMNIDTQLLAALEAGMPACSGLALGLDRLFALLQRQTSIAETMSFAFANL